MNAKYIFQVGAAIAGIFIGMRLGNVLITKMQKPAAAQP